MSLLASRIVTLLLLLVGTLTFGLLPIFVHRRMKKCDCNDEHRPGCSAKRNARILSFLIYFGGGVLLATCLIHLLPEAGEGFEKEAESSEGENAKQNGTDKGEEGHHEEFPIPEFVVCCGFFAVYLVEEIIHRFVGGHSHEGEGGGHGHSHFPSENPRESFRAMSQSFSRSCSGSVAEYPQGATAVIGCIRRDSILSSGHFPDIKQESEQKSKSFSISSRRSTIVSEKLNATFTISGLFTVVALSFHSLFEGFAVGLQKSELGTWTLFFAIAVHKFVIAFVVGLEVLMEGGRETVLAVYMVIFSAMSPLGSMVAIVTDVSLSDSSEHVVGVLNALATGTLLYVTFFEILQRNKKDDLSGLFQLLATFVGFGLMAIIQYLSTLA